MDAELSILVSTARFHQLPAEPEQLSQEFSLLGEVLSDTEILCAAKVTDLTAKQILYIPRI